MTEEAPDEEETKVRKRFCLILALLLAALALPALAEEQALWEYDDLNYYLKLNGELSGDVVIPSEVDGWAVSAIESSAFSNQNGVTSLTMPVTLRALQRLKLLPPMYSSPSFSVTLVRLSMPEIAPLCRARTVSGRVSEVTSFCP